MLWSDDGSAVGQAHHTPRRGAPLGLWRGFRARMGGEGATPRPGVNGGRRPGGRELAERGPEKHQTGIGGHNIPTFHSLRICGATLVPVGGGSLERRDSRRNWGGTPALSRPRSTVPPSLPRVLGERRGGLGQGGRSAAFETPFYFLPANQLGQDEGAVLGHVRLMVGSVPRKRLGGSSWGGHHGRGFRDREIAPRATTTYHCARGRR